MSCPVPILSVKLSHGLSKESLYWPGPWQGWGGRGVLGPAVVSYNPALKRVGFLVTFSGVDSVLSWDVEPGRVFKHAGSATPFLKALIFPGLFPAFIYEQAMGSFLPVFRTVLKHQWNQGDDRK